MFSTVFWNQHCQRWSASLQEESSTSPGRSARTHVLLTLCAAWVWRSSWWFLQTSAGQNVLSSLRWVVQYLRDSAELFHAVWMAKCNQLTPLPFKGSTSWKTFPLCVVVYFPDKYFAAVTCFLFFNAFAVAGNVLSSFVQKASYFSV